MSIPEYLEEAQLVPVVTIDSKETAKPLADLLLSVGISVIEVTLRTPEALEAIRCISDEFPEMTVGAGSVRDAGHVNLAQDAGAQFLVSPGFSELLIEKASEANSVLIPGAATPAEVLQLYHLGFDFIKFFPAELSGGVSMIKAISAPLPEISFFPTGGISETTVLDYLKLEQVVCVGGSWFLDTRALKDSDFETVRSGLERALQDIQ